MEFQNIDCCILAESVRGNKKAFENKYITHCRIEAPENARKPDATVHILWEASVTPHARHLPIAAHMARAQRMQIAHLVCLFLKKLQGCVKEFVASDMTRCGWPTAVQG